MSKKYGPQSHGSPDPDIEQVMKQSRASDPWDTSASGVGYNARWDDDAGTRNLAGHGVDGLDDNERYMPDVGNQVVDRDAPHQRLAALIDNDPSLPSGKLINGGGRLGRTGGVGAGKPRYAPKKPGHLVNRESRGGNDSYGKRR